MGNGDGRRLLPVGDALNAQHGLVSVLLDTDAVFLVEADAFGIENRRGGKLAIRRDDVLPSAMTVTGPDSLMTRPPVSWL